MAKKEKIIIHLVCSKCKHKNYTYRTTRKQQRKKLELKKYCRFCQKHTIHKEVR